MVVSDDYINKLFEGTKFGAKVDNCVHEKRKIIAHTLRTQVAGFWAGHTAYNIVVQGGFLHDAKRGDIKRLTQLGAAFLEEHGA